LDRDHPAVNTALDARVASWRVFVVNALFRKDNPPMAFITITIDTDNDAFQHEGIEVARILRALAADVRPLLRAESICGKPLLDANGNRVGGVLVTGKPNVNAK
jgi:hypothetical protein